MSNNEPNVNDRDVYGYRVFTYDAKSDTQAALRSFVSTAGLDASSLSSLQMTFARAVRFNGFLIARGDMRNATLVWSRVRASAQRRYMFYFVNRGVLQASGALGTRHAEGHGVGVIYPGEGEISLRTVGETDYTIFTFDAHAVAPHALDSDAELPPASPVLAAAAAFLTGVLSTQDTVRIQSAHILRRLTADVAISLLSEVSTASVPSSGAMILQIIGTNYTNPRFGVLDLCREVRLPRRTLERISADSGFTPSEAIRSRRAKHALELLLAQDKPKPQAVWRPSGFTSSEAMNRAFLHFYGESPREMFAQSQIASDTFAVDDLFLPGDEPSLPRDTRPPHLRQG